MDKVIKFCLILPQLLIIITVNDESRCKIEVIFIFIIFLMTLFLLVFMGVMSLVISWYLIKPDRW